MVTTGSGGWFAADSPNLFDDLYTGEVWDGRVAHALATSGFWTAAGGGAPTGTSAALPVDDNGGVNHSAVMYNDFDIIFCPFPT